MSGRHQDAAEQVRSGRRPAEYYIDEKWDKCIDLTLRRVTYSSLAAGAVALVLLSELAYLRLVLHPPKLWLCHKGFLHATLDGFAQEAAA